MEVVDLADAAGSTSKIIREIEAAPPGTRWAIGTEPNLVNRLKHEHPEQEIHLLSPVECLCSTMFRIDLPHLCWALENLAAGTPVNVIEVEAGNGPLGARGVGADAGSEVGPHNLAFAVSPSRNTHQLGEDDGRSNIAPEPSCRSGGRRMATCWSGAAQLPKPAWKPKVAMVQVTDLFRPFADPDDHWDLACIYALALPGRRGLVGVAIDYPPRAGV